MSDNENKAKEKLFEDFNNIIEMFGIKYVQEFLDLFIDSSFFDRKIIEQQSNTIYYYTELVNELRYKIDKLEKKLGCKKGDFSVDKEILEEYKKLQKEYIKNKKGVNKL